MEPELIGTAEIAQIVGLSREYVTDKLTKRQTFPRPAIDFSARSRRWRRKDVMNWLAKRRTEQAA